MAPPRLAIKTSRSSNWAERQDQHCKSKWRRLGRWGRLLVTVGGGGVKASSGVSRDICCSEARSNMEEDASAVRVKELYEDP